MHTAAYEFVKKYRNNRACEIIEIGSRNINGTVRQLFPYAKWIGLDSVAGPGVDQVVDAVEYQPERPADIVICCEVFEHAPAWQQMVRQSFAWLKPGGYLIVTCAGPGRNPHSAVDGGRLRDGEQYENVGVTELCYVAITTGYEIVDANKLKADTRLMARKPEH